MHRLHLHTNPFEDRSASRRANPPLYLILEKKNIFRLCSYVKAGNMDMDRVSASRRANPPLYL
jgi:hypothetical protein